MTKVLLYEVEIKGIKTAIESQQDLAKAINDTSKARKAEKFNTEEYNKLSVQLAGLKKIQEEFGKQDKQISDQFKETAKVAKDSFNGLGEELKSLRKLYADFSSDEKNSAIGKAALARIQEIRVAQKQFRDQEVDGIRKVREAEKQKAAEEKAAINRQKELADVGKNSYRALNAELVRLRNSYKDLTAEERQGAFGARTIKRIQELDRELKDIDASLGQFQRNVGNYGEAFQGTFSQLSGFDIAALTTIPGAISAGAELLVQGAQYVGQFTQELTKLRGELSKLVSEQDLDNAQNKVIALSKTFGAETDEIIQAANAASKQLGGTFVEALTLIEKGFLAGGNANGQFIDQFAELAPVAKQNGLTLDQFAVALTNAGQQGLIAEEDIENLIKTSKDLTGTVDDLIDSENEYVQQQQKTLALNEQLAKTQQEIAVALGGTGATISQIGVQIETVLLQALLEVITVGQDLIKTFQPLVDLIGDFSKTIGVANEESSGFVATLDLLKKAGNLVRLPFDLLLSTYKAFLGLLDSSKRNVSSFFETLSAPITRLFGAQDKSVKSLKTFTDLANTGKGEVFQFGKETETAATKIDKITTSATKAKKVVEEFGKGSLAFLRGEVSKLEREIDKASPKDQPALFERLFTAKGQLAKAEKEQKALLDNLTGFIGEAQKIQDASQRTFQRTQTITEDGVLKQVQISEKGLKVVGTSLLDRLADLGKEIGEGVQQFTTRTRTDLEVSLDALLEEFGSFFTSGRFFDTLTEAGAAISGLASARNESELNAIEERYAKEIELAGDNTKKKEKLEKELAAEQERIRKKEFEQQKRFRIAAALSSLASGTVNILSTPSIIPDPLGALYKAAQIAFLTFKTTSQIAQISAQKAAKGMIIKGPSHAHGGVPVQVGNQVIEAEGGEWMGDDGQGGTAIINKHNTGRYYPILKQLSAVNFPGKRVVLSAINADRGYGVKFEQGGLLEPNFSKMNVGVSGGISIVSIDANSIQNMAAAVGVGAKRGVEAGLVVANRENERIAKAEEKSKI